MGRFHKTLIDIDHSAIGRKKGHKKDHEACKEDFRAEAKAKPKNIDGSKGQLWDAVKGCNDGAKNFAKERNLTQDDTYDDADNGPDGEPRERLKKRNGGVFPEFTAGGKFYKI